MAITKIGSRAIIDGSILAADFAPGSVSADKLAGSIENSKLSNSTITIGGQAISLGGSNNALNLVDWQSKITSDGSTVTTMVSGRGYFIDNSSAAGLVKLPASASIGDFVAIKDYAGNFGTNNLTIQRNGHNIQGVAADSSISTNRASLVLVYVDATKGWLYTDEHNAGDLGAPVFTEATGGTITTSGDFKIHSFTGDGCFVVSQLGNSPTNPQGGPQNVDHLVVAGGGGGASSTSSGARGGGGGGAGGHRTSFPSPGCNAGAFPISAQTYPITVGGGGSKGTGGADGSSGSNSVFSTITSAGGGGGGGTDNSNGVNGGSGGGATSTGTAGSGNTPPVSPSQGNPGGQKSGGVNVGSGGGGGAGGAGSNFTIPGSNFAADSGPGGNGVANSITGSSVTRAGGGGGGAAADAFTDNGTGGPGGGGDGASRLSVSVAGAGGANTGGGGGGAADASSGPGCAPGDNGNSGGSGIVIIRYKYQ